MPTTSRDGAPVTKAELKIELEAFRAGFTADLRESVTADLRESLRADLGNLNTASDERLAALEECMTNVEKRMIEKRL